MDPVGEQVRIGDSPFTVIGVLQPKIQNSSYNSRDEDRVFIPASTHAAIFGSRFVSNLVYRTADASRTAAVEARVYEVLGRKYRFDPQDEDALEHEGLSRGRRIRLREDDLDLVLRAIPEFEFGSPSYGRGRTHLEAGENQTTTYMEGVSPIFSELRRMFPAPGGRFINQRDIDQRRRVLFLGDEIAARLFGDTRPVGQTVLLDGLSFRVDPTDERALGIWDFIEDEKIVGQIGFGIQVFLGLVGAFTLLVAGVGVANIMNPKLSLPIASTCVGLLMVIGLVAGILPARKAARLDPVESLRYE